VQEDEKTADASPSALATDENHLVVASGAGAQACAGAEAIGVAGQLRMHLAREKAPPASPATPAVSERERETGARIKEVRVTESIMTVHGRAVLGPALSAVSAGTLSSVLGSALETSAPSVPRLALAVGPSLTGRVRHTKRGWLELCLSASRPSGALVLPALSHAGQ
jgi:hypothetical protein